MRPIGFSTGALALGDFRRGIRLLEGHAVQAVELSALRETEVEGLARALDELNLRPFQYVSIHAPSRLSVLPEARVVELLSPCIARRIPIVLHPDAIVDASRWLEFGDLLCLENMDNRKRTGRTAAELEPFFASLPDARFCFDIAHAHQVDGTMIAARKLLRRFGPRLAQVHLSEIDAGGHHHGLSKPFTRAVQRVAHLIPENVPILLESQIDPVDIDLELEMAAIGLARERPSVSPTDDRHAAAE